MDTIPLSLGARIGYAVTNTTPRKLDYFRYGASQPLAFDWQAVQGGLFEAVLERRWPSASATGSGASELESALPTERVEIGPLSVGAIHRLLSDRLGRSFARQTLLRIHDQSGGNPFFALEIARALDGDVDPLEPLPVPPTLDGLVRVRLTGLPPATRDALGLAAAIGTPSEVLLEQAGVPEGALDPALAATRRRARRRDDPLHASVAVVGALQRPRRPAPERSRSHCR